MARISYPEYSGLDEESKVYLDYARLHGTPRPESQAIRAHIPGLLKTFTSTWRTAFFEGVLDTSVKELCRLYISRTVECEYCGAQRSEAAAAQGVSESKLDELLDFERSESYDMRERTALRYAQAIAWDSSLADDQLWADLHAHFTEPELVELGYFIALTLGQQRWLKTLDIGHKEYLADTDAGLAPGVVAARS